MNNRFLLQANLTPAVFSQWLATLGLPDDALAWIEWPDGWALGRWRDLRDDRAPTLVDSSAGRVFHDSGELRWRVLPCLGAHPLRAVYLGAQLWPGLTPMMQDESHILTGLEPRRVQHVLWGEYYDPTGEWVELRIPQRFRYPLHARSQRVALVAELWESTTGGEPGFVRYCALIAFEGGEAHA